MQTTRLLAVNEAGIRVGEDHQRAKLTNAEVDKLLDLHEEHGMGYGRLAELFGVSKSTTRDICRYLRRAQHAVDFRRSTAPTIEQRREADPEHMGPLTAPCTGCYAPIPFRSMHLLGGYRWCEHCYTIALNNAKNTKTTKKRKNTQQTQLFAL